MCSVYNSQDGEGRPDCFALYQIYTHIFSSSICNNMIQSFYLQEEIVPCSRFWKVSAQDECFLCRFEQWPSDRFVLIKMLKFVLDYGKVTLQDECLLLGCEEHVGTKLFNMLIILCKCIFEVWKIMKYEAVYEVKHGIFLHKNIDILLNLCLTV